MFRKLPLIVILGSTGTGKTKLSIELAQRFGGEIISADSMQVYKELDVVTAKATKEEQGRAPHHLLDVAHPGVPYTVVDFRDAALTVVDDLLGRSKIPIIVGGTNYYIESLLWKVLVNPPAKPVYEYDDNDSLSQPPPKRAKLEPPTDETHQPKAPSSSPCKPEIDLTNFDAITLKNLPELYNYTPASLHKHLQTIDPLSASRLHPNNKRKIIRALEIFIENGKTMSQILAEQRSIPGGGDLGGPLRYSHIVLFWLVCDQTTLNERLNKRVHDMVSRGLLTEIRKFHEVFVKPFNDKDYTKGVLQTIGFKEFLPYLTKYDATHDSELLKYFESTDEERLNVQQPDTYDLFIKCLDELKLVTIRYSKKQMKWIRNRLLASRTRQVPPLYSLDTSDPSKWNDEIYLKAENIVQSYIDDVSPRHNPSGPIENPREGLDEETSMFCEACQRVFVGEYQWHIHLQSNKHKKMVKRKTVEVVKAV